MSLSADTSLIVSSYHRYDLLKAYVETTLCHHPDLELVVVDVDPPRDEVYPLLHDGHKLILLPRANYAQAINAGLRKATRQYLVWGNEDIRVTGPWVDDLVQLLVDDPRRLVGVGASKQCGWEFIVGWLVAMHRDALRDIGYLDETFPGTFEDVDYSVRAAKAGYRLAKTGRGVLPVTHVSLGRLNAHLHEGKRLLLEKHGRPDERTGLAG